MEFELQRTALEGYRPVLDTVLTKEEVTESIIPDAYPDVFRLVGSTGTMLIDSKIAENGCGKVSGSVRVQILYMPEDKEKGSCCIGLNIPILCSAEHPLISDHAQIHATVLAVNTDVQLINPRKILLKTEVLLDTKVYIQETRAISCDMAEKNSAALQKQVQGYSDYAVSAVFEKSFLFSDTLRPSAAKPIMEEILFHRAEIGTVEAKYIGKKLVCKGELDLFVVYRSNHELLPARFELPFSQILEFESSYDEGEPNVYPVLKGLDYTLNEGAIELSAEVLLQATLWSHRDVMVLHDVYSTTAPLDVERVSCCLCTAHEGVSKRESVRKFCESGIPAKQVLNCHVCAGPLVFRRDEKGANYHTDATIEILYQSEDGELCCVFYQAPVDCMTEDLNESACSCICKLVGETIAVPVTGGFEVRFDLDFCWHSVVNEQIYCVSAVHENKQMQVNERRPSLVIRMVGQKECLWDIAKACNATIQDICMANQLPVEFAEPGSVLLIPVSR